MVAESRLRTALRRGRARAQTRAARAASALGFELRRKTFYLPFPDVDRLPDSLWADNRATPGLDLRIEEASQLLKELGPSIREFSATGFPIQNGSYEWGDAETLYAMLRRLKPTRVVELGSGASSHVIALAQAANADQGNPFVYEGYDPFPGWHEMGKVSGAAVHPVAAEDLDPSVVRTLRPDDVLFVDTTHTVKTGGDVVHIVLDMLPLLSPGVYVHFHDIFLPSEYPKEWVVDRRQAWAEQYLLQAFLAFNPVFEVVLPVHALTTHCPDLVREMIPSFTTTGGAGPGAFWLRRER